jgi:hypothetical protein
MGDYPRRIYTFRRPVQDDDDAASNGWQPDTTGAPQASNDQPQYPYSDYPESYQDQGGGLLGMLLASQAQQNSDLARSDRQPPSEPASPDIRKLTRVYAGPLPRGTNDFPDRPGDQSGSYSPVGDDNSSDRSRGADEHDQAMRPDRSLADRLQAYWEHPHPYGLISHLKEALYAIPQVVQSSIDATRVPSTEEEAFRKNLAREQGPIAAWRAASLLNPMVPRGTGGVLAKPLVDAIINRGVSPQAGQSIARQGIGESITNTGAPAARLVSRYRNLPPELQDAAALGAPRSAVPLSPTQNVPPASGGLFRTNSERPALPWIATAPGIQAGLDVIEAARKKGYRGPLPKGVNLLDWFAKQPLKKPYGSQGGLGGGGGPRKGVSGDPDDPCNDLHIKEQNRCIERLHNEEYADVRHFGGCKDRAAERMRLCYKTGRPPIKPKEWGPDDEEIFNRDFRLR